MEKKELVMNTERSSVIAAIDRKTVLNITYGSDDTMWHRIKQVFRWIWTGKAEFTAYYY